MRCVADLWGVGLVGWWGGLVGWWGGMVGVGLVQICAWFVPMLAETVGLGFRWTDTVGFPVFFHILFSRNDFFKVNCVREIIKSTDGFKSIKIIKRNKIGGFLTLLNKNFSKISQFLN